MANVGCTASGEIIEQANGVKARLRFGRLTTEGLRQVASKLFRHRLRLLIGEVISVPELLVTNLGIATAKQIGARTIT